MQTKNWPFITVLLFLLVPFLANSSKSSELERFSSSPYKIFLDAIKIKEQGSIPLVFLDIDDTLIQTAFRYLDVIEALNDRFDLFTEKLRSKQWQASHHLRPGDLIYSDSFEKTLRLTLERLVTRTEMLEKMYEPNARGIPVAMQIFFEVFFDPKRVSKDTMYPGAVFFLNNLLSLMRSLGGKVVFLSGRADKYLEITKESFRYNGISSELLSGEHVLWYLKPSSGKINFTEDVQLDFKNDKAGMIKSLVDANPHFEVAGFVDNETRNVFSLIGNPNVPKDRLYFLRSVDATWGVPADADIVTDFLNRIRNEPSHFIQFGSFRIRPDQASVLKKLFGKSGARYVNRYELLQTFGVDRKEFLRQKPIEASQRALTYANQSDCDFILGLWIP